MAEIGPGYKVDSSQRREDAPGLFAVQLHEDLALVEVDRDPPQSTERELSEDESIVLEGPDALEAVDVSATDECHSLISLEKVRRRSAEGWLDHEVLARGQESMRPSGDAGDFIPQYQGVADQPCGSGPVVADRDADLTVNIGDLDSKVWQPRFPAQADAPPACNGSNGTRQRRDSRERKREVLSRHADLSLWRLLHPTAQATRVASAIKCPRVVQPTGGVASKG